MGYNYGYGFRAGTSHPYLMGGENEKFILEIPLIIMDTSLELICKGDFDKMYKIIIETINKVENVEDV